MIMNLAGDWRFRCEDSLDFSHSQYIDDQWETMPIPGNWFLSGMDHHGVIWYRQQFRFPSPGGYNTLHFDGVDYKADVYLNDHHLGSHIGYFEPFSFDVTGKLQSGNNMLVVRVESPFETPGPNGWHLHKRVIKGVLNHHDCRPGGGWEATGQSFNTGGIWNQVYLEKHGPITIDRLLLHADLEGTSPILHAEITLHNRSMECSTTRLKIQLTPDNFKGKPQVGRFLLDVPAGESIQKLHMPVENSQIWQPWDRGFPHLYRVTIILPDEPNTPSHSELFGFRTIHVDQEMRWSINGQPYFPRGSNYLASQWLSETLFPTVAEAAVHPFGFHSKVPGSGSWFERDVSLAKLANLNILRVHAHILPPEFHEACDRAGLLVWQDFPLQWGYSDEPAFQDEAIRQAKAMVSLLQNHASIVVWCCHNESPCDAPWMAGEAGEIYDPTHNRELDIRLEQTILHLDPSRYVHRNSGTGDGHVYPGWYVGHWRDFRDFPGAPLLTEYGAQGLPNKETILHMFPELGPDAGYASLIEFKDWLDSNNRISPLVKSLVQLGTILYNLVGKLKLKAIQEWMKGWGIKVDRSSYKKIPGIEETPEEYHHARDVWEKWRFHDFQPAETFDNGILPGTTLDDFIVHSQTYQAHLLQYATETYRHARYCLQNAQKPLSITGLIQFDFTDPWPAITWSVLDYWRNPKASFNALRHAMQPILPSFLFPEKIVSGKSASLIFRVINDSLEPFQHAVCEWRLKGRIHEIASAFFQVTIPADGISEEVKLTLPSLRAGDYVLYVKLTTGIRLLGENEYQINIEQSKGETL